MEFNGIPHTNDGHHPGICCYYFPHCYKGKKSGVCGWCSPLGPLTLDIETDTAGDDTTAAEAAHVEVARLVICKGGTKTVAGSAEGFFARGVSRCCLGPCLLKDFDVNYFSVGDFDADTESLFKVSEGGSVEVFQDAILLPG